MVFGNVISIRKAEPDSQFRLINCPVCGSDNVAYVEYKSGNQEPWRVDCFECGHSVDGKSVTRHGAQVLWNKAGKVSA